MNKTLEIIEEIRDFWWSSEIYRFYGSIQITSKSRVKKIMGSATYWLDHFTNYMIKFCLYMYLIYLVFLCVVIFTLYIIAHMYKHKPGVFMKTSSSFFWMKVRLRNLTLPRPCDKWDILGTFGLVYKIDTSE